MANDSLTSNEQLAQALRNLRDVAHREVSPRYSAALDEAFTLADIALGEFDSEGDVSREADVGPGGGVRATHATGSAPSKPGAAEPPTASREQQLLTELAYWKARCGVMHGDETNAVTKSATVPVLPTSEEDERIVDAAIKRRLSDETEATQVTTYEVGETSGVCKHCGLSWLLHIAEDDRGRKNVCAPIKRAESENARHD